MARVHQFHVGDLARVLSYKCMADAYEYVTMTEGEEKNRISELMRSLAAKYGDEVGHVRAIKGDLVQMDYHCQNRWFYDWMLIPTQVKPLDESVIRGGMG